MEDVAVHQYHYPDGRPLTYEYPLESSVPDEHAAKLSPFVRDFLGDTEQAVRGTLAKRWLGLPAVVEPLAAFLLSLKPTSVAFTDWPKDSIRSTESDSWLVFRGGQSKFLALGGAAPMPEAISSCDWIPGVAGLRELLTEFGNLQTTMLPPCGGFLLSEMLIDSADTDIRWGETGEWENGLPIYQNGSGDCLCVSIEGTVGIWSNSNFQSAAPNLADFVKMFVSRERTGKSPDAEWWW